MTITCIALLALLALLSEGFRGVCLCIAVYAFGPVVVAAIPIALFVAGGGVGRLVVIPRLSLHNITAKENTIGHQAEHPIHCDRA
jgi:hypothetical protein